jgi:3-oxoacyl-[acyl-carrier-protein] synthase-3
MTNAAITGWGKCMPPAVLSNADLATFLDTDDAWITQRTGSASGASRTCSAASSRTSPRRRRWPARGSRRRTST